MSYIYIGCCKKTYTYIREVYNERLHLSGKIDEY